MDNTISVSGACADAVCHLTLMQLSVPRYFALRHSPVTDSKLGGRCGILQFLQHGWGDVEASFLGGNLCQLDVCAAPAIELLSGVLLVVAHQARDLRTHCPLQLR